LRLPVAVVEVIASDITKRLEDQGGVVLGVKLLDSENPCQLSEQAALAEEVVTALYVERDTGRIPCVAILEDPSGAVATRLAALLARGGLCAGIASKSEISIAGRSWTPPGPSTAERARAIFQAPMVDVALLNLSHEELNHSGLGNDVCNVAVVLDSRQSAAVGVAEAGILVLPFEQSLRAKGALSAERIIWFAAHENSSPLAELLDGKSRAVFAQSDSIVLAQGSATRVQLGKRPENLKSEELAPMLAALAAALALGLSIEELKAYLST
jgi:hypothetical protein